MSLTIHAHDVALSLGCAMLSLATPWPLWRQALLAVGVILIAWAEAHI